MAGVAIAGGDGMTEPTGCWKEAAGGGLGTIAGAALAVEAAEVVGEGDGAGALFMTGARVRESVVAGALSSRCTSRAVASMALSAAERTGSATPCSALRNRGSRSPRLHIAALPASAASTMIAASAATRRGCRASTRAGFALATTPGGVGMAVLGAMTVTAVGRPERVT